MAISTLLDAIEQKGVLRLNMAWTIINDTVAARIAESFESLSMLQVLDLSSAMLRSETATIAQGLQNSSIRLRQVLFTHNDMSSEGAEALALYFEQIDTLEVVDISQNSIETDGLTPLCRSLQPSARSQLCSLNLAENWFNSTECLNELVSLLNVSRQLERVDLSDLQIDKIKK